MVVAENRDSDGSSETSVSSPDYKHLESGLKIAEMEFQTQQLRKENNARAPMEASALFSLGEDRMLKFASLLKAVLPPMPNQEPLVPGWFEEIEATLAAYGVPSEWRAGLVLPLLSERARALLTSLGAAERTQYEKLKRAILEG